MSFTKVVIERDTDSEEESSSGDENDQVDDYPSEEEDDDDQVLENEASTTTSRKTKTKPITISLKKVCKVKSKFLTTPYSKCTSIFSIFRPGLNPCIVSTCWQFEKIWNLSGCIRLLNCHYCVQVCKRSGHEAGFKGATYIDCPMKPCFLCKMPGKYLLAQCTSNLIFCFQIILLIVHYYCILRFMLTPLFLVSKATLQSVVLIERLQNMASSQHPAKELIIHLNMFLLVSLGLTFLQ